MDMELGTHPTKLELAIRTETFSTYMTWVHLSADMYCAQSKCKAPKWVTWGARVGEACNLTSFGLPFSCARPDYGKKVESATALLGVLRYNFPHYF